MKREVVDEGDEKEEEEGLAVRHHSLRSARTLSSPTEKGRQNLAASVLHGEASGDDVVDENPRASGSFSQEEEDGLHQDLCIEEPPGNMPLTGSKKEEARKAKSWSIPPMEGGAASSPPASIGVS